MPALPILKAPSMRVPSRAELRSAEEHRIHDIDQGQLYDPDRLRDLEYRMRLALIRREIMRNTPPRGLIADIGCAQGNASFLLRDAGYRVVASDLRLDYVRYSLRKGPLWGMVANGESLPFSTGSLDAVILGEVLEHVAHPERFLAEGLRVLRPGGILVATTPNGSHRVNTLPTWSDVRDFADDLEDRQFQPDADGHLFLYTSEELLALLGDAGFTAARVISFYTSLTARVAFKTSHSTWWRPFRGLSPAAASALALLDGSWFRGSRERETSALVASAMKPVAPGA